MNDYKIEFIKGGAGFPAKDLKEAHQIAKEYADDNSYRMFKKTTCVKGWLYVGAGN